MNPYETLLSTPHNNNFMDKSSAADNRLSLLTTGGTEIKLKPEKRRIS